MGNLQQGDVKKGATSKTDLIPYLVSAERLGNPEFLSTLLREQSKEGESNANADLA